jgi:hypothetical protein
MIRKLIKTFTMLEKTNESSEEFAEESEKKYKFWSVNLRKFSGWVWLCIPPDIKYLPHNEHGVRGTYPMVAVKKTRG